MHHTNSLYPIIITLYLILASLNQTTSTVHAQTFSPTTSPPATAQPKQSPRDAYTQGDLSIITANTQRPNGMTWIDGKLYTVCSGDWTIYEIDPEDKTTKQYIYGVRNAHSILGRSKGGENELWIPDFQQNTLVRIRQGSVTTVTSNLAGPWGIASINETEFVLSNLLGNTLIRIDESGNTEEIITNLKSPTGVAAQNDIIFVANTGSTRRAIEWYSLNPEASNASGILVSGLQNTTSITLAYDNMLYFAYALGTRGVVGRVDPAKCIEMNGCTNDQVEVVLYTELPAPLAGLTITPDSRLYIHTIFSPDIYWVQLSSKQP